MQFIVLMVLTSQYGLSVHSRRRLPAAWQN